MEDQIPGWIQLFGNIAGVGLLVWFLWQSNKRNEQRNDEKEKVHNAEMEAKNRELIACRDAQIATLKEVLTVTANNNIVIATNTAAVQKITEALVKLEAHHVTPTGT